MSVPASLRIAAAVGAFAIALNIVATISDDPDPRAPRSVATTESAQSELPGGGTTLIPGRRLVALYGHPASAGLGALGEQDLHASLLRVKRLAARYEKAFRRPVLPTFEIIASVAHNDNGPHTRLTPIKDLRLWVDAARKAGVYVILDLQPGRMDFLTQAKAYEPLLREPHVGLALDPEWRLKSHQRHLQQIGSVRADEVNDVSAWLAALVRDRDLPQKAFVLHQFSVRMISGRAHVVTRPELATIIHVDGQGSPGAKRETWAVLRRDAPAGVHWGWKNFFDEDRPMLTLRETTQVSPTPHLITYQ